MSEPLIRAEGLTKRYRRSTGGKGLTGFFGRSTETVDGLVDATFRVEPGEIVGLLGPNGAGKSTTVKLLTGILRPDGGSCSVGGLVPWRDRRTYTAGIGTVFGQRMQLWWDVPILDSFRLLRDIYRVEETAWKNRLDELAEALALGDLLNVPLRQLSLGQRMRAELCGSLLHSPKLLFLDEPTIGLDAVSKLNLREFLLLERERHGTTILLTTHDMADMQALCRRVLVLGHGRLLYDGSLHDILQRYDTRHEVRCRFTGEPVWPDIPSSVALRRDEGEWELSFAPHAIPADEVLRLILAAGRIEELTLKEAPVDEMVAEMYNALHLS
ncbi:MAG: ATP-binding cassette domain-containing protein [Clostridia bacterium]|nr:ATP-binding cassette domain-containing protein [Clostridia bacterium]